MCDHNHSLAFCSLWRFSSRESFRVVPERGYIVLCSCPHLHCVVFRTVGKIDPIFLFFSQPIVGHTTLHEGIGTCLEHCSRNRNHRPMDNFSFFLSMYPQDLFWARPHPHTNSFSWIAALQIYLDLVDQITPGSWWQSGLCSNLVAHCQAFSFHWGPIAGQELSLKGRTLDCRSW